MPLVRPASGGRFVSAGRIDARYCVDSRLPSTATPIAPPIWRFVSFIAEPMPALPRGTAPMIESVAGVIANPMPKLKMMIARAMKP